jgi:hypothetical protein
MTSLGHAAMKLAIVALGVTGAAACPDGFVSPLETDAGRLDDGGPDDDDAGPGDAGTSDGGFDAGDDTGPEDAGEADAGPPPCVTEPVDADYTCEPDQDFCDPPGDGIVPHVDILAGWSRVEDGAFIVDLLFRAPPFADGDVMDISIGLLEDADDMNNDTGMGVVLDFESHFFDVDRQFNLNQPQPVYPPSVFSTTNGAVGGELPLSDVSTTEGGRLVRFVLRGDAPYGASQMSYIVVVNHTGDAFFGADEATPNAPSFESSVGGSPDVAELFEPIDTATCPAAAE